MKNLFPALIRKKIVSLAVCGTLITGSYAQHMLLNLGDANVEAGINFGPTLFLGDLGGKVGKGTTFIKDLNYPLAKLMKGAFINVYPRDWWGIRLGAQLTYVEGVDSIISTHGVDELWRKQRNLDFKSNMWEVYTALEFFPLQYLYRNDEEYDPRLRPYVFAGVGVFHFNPKGSLRDQAGNVSWHELQPLRTEGQGFAEYPDRKPYKLTQLNIPLGGGVKYLLSDKVNLGLELLYRKTFTDYIDDVSTTYIDRSLFPKYLDAASASIATRIADKTIGIVTPGTTSFQPGDTRGFQNKDAYFSLLFKIGIRLTDNDGGYGGGSGGGYGGGSGYGGGGGRSGGGGRASRNSTRCPVRF